MADFYGTEAGFEAYCEARAITAPAGDVEPALLRASVWLDGTYRDRFSGYRTQQRLQVREWPRYDAIDAECNGIPATEVPVEIIEATYEAALRELAPERTASSPSASVRWQSLTRTPRSPTRTVVQW
jgi:hypothetical protein